MQLATVCLLFALICSSQSLNILQFVPGFSNSWQLFNYRIAAALNSHGHNVTTLFMKFIPLEKQLSPPPGITEIQFDATGGVSVDEYAAGFNSDFVYKPVNIKTTLAMGRGFNNLNKVGCQAILASDTIRELMNSSRFDFALSHVFGVCPVVLLSEAEIPVGFASAGSYIIDSFATFLGIPFPTSYVPESMTFNSDVMTFRERLKNLFFSTLIVGTLKMGLDVFGAEETVIRSPPHDDRLLPTETASNVAVIFLNGEQMLDFPRPMTSNIHYLGDMGKKELKQLTPEWQKLVDESTNGFIVFSLGTVANTTAMPMEWKMAFVDSLGRFPDITVFWRFIGDFPEAQKYPNIKLTKWLPQAELLAHPKCRLFLTHGGYSSFLETAESGKPVVMIPLFFDQLGNARRAERFGLGLYLDKLSLTADKIYNAIDTILTDKKYERNAMKLSSMLSDKIRPNEDLTIEHIERIARHYNSYPRLSRSIRKLSAVQFYSLDVLTLFTLALVVIFSALIHIVKSAWKFVEAQACQKMLNKTKKQTKLD